MPFSTPPDVVSLRGDAQIVRHVYLSGLAKSYSVWTARLSSAGFSIVTRPSDAVDFNNRDHSDRVILGPISSVNSMAVKETTTDVAAIVYETHDGLWVVEYDYANQAVTSGPTFLYVGTDPSLAVDVADVMSTYLRAGAMKTRRGLLGSELEIVRPSSTDIIDQDTHEKTGVPTVLRYAGLVGQNSQVARRFVPDGDSEAVYDSGLATQIPGAPVPVEEVDGGTDGVIGDNVTIGYPSAIGSGQSYLFQTPAAEQENWGLVFGPYGIAGAPPAISLGDQWSFHIWMITPQTNYSTVFLRVYATSGEYVNIHLPWSDGTLYFDTYDVDLNLDRINKTLGAVPGMEHWVFTQNSVTGVRKIFRDGAEWHSGTSLFNSIPNISRIYLGHDGNKVYGWDGEIAEFGIFSYDLSLEQAQELNAGLPGYLRGDEPGLERYWKFDDSTLITALKDLSGNGKHLGLGVQDYDTDGIEIRHFYPQIDTIPAGPGVTVEAWVKPQLASYESWLVRADELSFGYKNDGSVFFTITQPDSLYTGLTGSISSFGDGGGGTKTLVNSSGHGLSNGAVVSIYGSNGYLGYHAVSDVLTNSFTIAEAWVPAQGGTGTWAVVPEVVFSQTGGRVLDPSLPNYVAVSHEFGNAASTFMVVNGSQVDASWIVGDGAIVPGYATFSRLDFRLGHRDRLLEWHMRSVAKSLSEILDYSKGKV
jgi:hypothetical protein